MAERSLRLEEVTETVVRLGRLASEQPGMRLGEADARLLERVAAWAGPPLEILQVWQMALGLCTSVELLKENPELAEMVRAIGIELLDRRSLPAGVALTAGLLVHEALVLAALAIEDRELARRALRRMGARMNELFLAADLGPSFLALRPLSLALHAAALLAFDRVDRALAVELAEAGRMKLLSAVAAGGAHAPSPRPLGAVTEARQTVSPAVGELLRALAAADDGAIHELVRSRLRPHELSELLVLMTQPWERLVATRDLKPDGRRVTDELWVRALAEPTIEWIVSALEPHQLLVYPFIERARCGFVLVTAAELTSVVVPRAAAEAGSDAQRRDHLTIGHTLAINLADAFSDAAVAAQLSDVRFVAWDPQHEGVLQQIATGFWMVPAFLRREDATLPSKAPALVPSARLLRGRVNRPSSDAMTATLIGDPTRDLAGPWIEAIAWRERLGERAHVAMGLEATRARMLEALQRDDVVVVSGHTVGTVGDERFGLRLADESLTHTDLLAVSGTVRTSLVILSSCSAAAVVSGPIEAEIIGLATTLLALGVGQVLAPLAPVGDRDAGIIGAVIAASIADGHDLRAALARAAATGASARGGPIRASADLPPAWRDACPHDARALRARGVVAAAAYLRTLTEFSVFGGDRAASGRDRPAS